MQGFHSPHLLVVIDEAGGVEPDIWEAITGLHPHRILAIGNPLEPSGEFFNCFQSDLWHKITINCEEAVAWQKEHGKIQGLVDDEWITERKHEWGPKSPLYQARVLGEFPEEGPGTLIQRRWVERARKGIDCDGLELQEENEEDSARIVAADVATKHGESYTVITYRYGHTLKTIQSFFRHPTHETVLNISLLYQAKKPHSVVVDSDGFGEGVADVLVSKKVPVNEFHGGYGDKAIEYTRFHNLRSQFYWMVAKKFEKGIYNLKHIPDREYEILKNQLCSVKVKTADALGRVQIETKEDMMVRGIKSPDFADAFVYGEYGFWSAKNEDIRSFRYENVYND